MGNVKYDIMTRGDKERFYDIENENRALRVENIKLRRHIELLEGMLHKPIKKENGYE